MRLRFIACAVLTSSTAGGLLACGGGDDSAPPARAPVADAGPSSDATSDATTVDAQALIEAGDGAVAETGADAEGASAADASVASRLLLSFNGGTQSELVAFGLDSKQVDGRLTYPGFIGTTAIGPKAPWLLEQANDVVARLEPAQPWKIASSWNVSLNDGPDGGGSYSDPDAIIVGAADKAYVLRYTRNEIAVIDPAGDGGSAIAAIDLGGELQAAGDGTVEMSAGVYVPSKRLVYVLLGNVNRHDVADDGYTLLCANTHATVVAIDVATDTLVDLNGSAAGSGLALTGYNPSFGTGAMAYDAESDRLLILENGCNQVIPAGADAGDGGDASTATTVGPLVGREVEELSLFTGETRTLLDLTQTGEFPSQLIYIDARRAILQLYSTYTWDPTTPALGPAIPNAPDSFAYDGAANLLGVSAIYGADGGLSGYDVQSVRIADGKVTKLGSNPFSLVSGFLSGAQLWPAP
ncbi:MAG TPA: hypothetical protein VII82_08895 [Polyangiaceae bacterium]